MNGDRRTTAWTVAHSSGLRVLRQRQELLPHSFLLRLRRRTVDVRGIRCSPPACCVRSTATSRGRFVPSTWWGPTSPCSRATRSSTTGVLVSEILRSRQPVTTRTRFRIASNTKSMTSLLLARYVDDGLVRWNTRVADLWPGFRAPTARLTSSLRLADLLGMGTGIAEPATAEFFISAGEDSALDVLQSIPYLPVLAAPGTEYHYNNTLVSAAPFLVLLDQGTKPADLMERYAAEVQRVIFGPIGMRDSGVRSDPRPVTSDFATGYHVDLFGTFRRTPFISIDGQGPSGSAMSSSTDMAR